MGYMWGLCDFKFCSLRNILLWLVVLIRPSHSTRTMIALHYITTKVQSLPTTDLDLPDTRSTFWHVTTGNTYDSQISELHYNDVTWSPWRPKSSTTRLFVQQHDEPTGFSGSLRRQSIMMKYGLTLIPAWISNYIPYKAWDEITYPFPKFNYCTVEVWEWIHNFIPHFTRHAITHPCWS